MKGACERLKEQLVESALTGTITEGLEGHLRTCVSCSEELDDLRARNARLDRLLPLVAGGSEPSAGFRVRVLAVAETAGEANSARPRRIWKLAGATAVVLSVLVIGVTLYRKTALAVAENELAAAQRLAEWRAPSDTLLATPGREILRTMPRLGESYLNEAEKTLKEE